jgi:sarcosine oxidase subunit beta
MNQSAEVVICGAGIAGISAAYHLSVHYGVREVVLVDEGPPLSLTSDKSTECYRNWWPGPDEAMVSLMNRSIDIMERLASESGNIFHLNRRGYLYLTADEARLDQFVEWSQIPSGLGAGPLRIHKSIAIDNGYTHDAFDTEGNQPHGADLLLNSQLIQDSYPYLSDDIIAALHVRRAGWLSAQQLGMYMLERARDHGVKLVRSRVTGVTQSGGRVAGVILDGEAELATCCLVAAPGPRLNQVANMLGLDLPVFNELHLKISFDDYLQVLPRSAPMLIWQDSQHLPWTPEEREILQGDPQDRQLLSEMPPGVHTRPEGGPGSTINLMLWEYAPPIMEPVWPIPKDPQYPETVLRGLSRMVPGLKAYFYKSRQPYLDGGYYTKTRENRPLIGPLPVEGAFVLGALSGFGIMASSGAGDLLAAHVTGSPLASYAPAFHPDRYRNPQYMRLVDQWGDSGQL